MQTALSTIKLLPATKAELKAYTDKVKAEILNGFYNPLEVAGMLKAMEELTETLRKDADIKSAIEAEADKYSEKTIDFGTYQITKSQRSTKDYTGVDPILDDMETSLEKTKAMIKARKSVIDTGVDPSTGETFRPVPFTTQTILAVKLK